MIPALHDDLGQPGEACSGHREARARAQRDGVARAVVLRPQVRRPDERGVHDRRDDPDRHGLLLLRLSAGAPRPAEDERVDAVGADGEDYHADVPPHGVQSRAGGDETDRGDDLGDGDVPGALVELARAPGDENRHRARDQVWRARQHQRGCAAES